MGVGKRREQHMVTVNGTSAEERVVEMGLRLPEAPTPFGAYVPAVRTGRLLFLSGMLATSGHAVSVGGVLGRDVSVERGREGARAAALNALALVRKELGSLDRVGRVVRVGVYVAATPEFTEHAKVADGASELLRDVLGAERMASRLVIGAASLPLGSVVELEVILEVMEGSAPDVE